MANLVSNDGKPLQGTWSDNTGGGNVRSQVQGDQVTCFGEVVSVSGSDFSLGSFVTFKGAASGTLYTVPMQDCRGNDPRKVPSTKGSDNVHCTGVISSTSNLASSNQQATVTITLSNTGQSLVAQCEDCYGSQSL